MINRIILSVAVIASVVLSGCSFLNEQPYRQVDYFDLGSPAQYSMKGITVKFMKFRGLEAAKYKMVYHEDDTRVLIDDYNKWIQTPGFMLNRFLQTSFSSNQNAATEDTRSYDVSGTLFEFKIDLKKQLVVLGVTYIIRDGNSNAMPPLVEKSVSYTAPFKERSGYAFAQAMTQAAQKLTESIYKDIKKDFKQEKEVMPTTIPPSGKPLISSEQISSRIETLGQQISADLAGENETVLLTVADGALIFSADLSRTLSIPIYMDQIAVSSYKGTASSGKITLRTEPRLDLTGKNILLVDDILDTGQTISYLISYLEQFNPHRIYICVMLDKPSGRKVPVHADYVGFEVPDKFIIGYGMDHDGLYRNLPSIFCLD